MSVHISIVALRCNSQVPLPDPQSCCGQEARRRREAAKARKLENQKKSAVVQKITNPATLKRMLKSKKQRKKIAVADTL